MGEVERLIARCEDLEKERDEAHRKLSDAVSKLRRIVRLATTSEQYWTDENYAFVKCLQDWLKEEEA
jgi:hypothetical protein